MQSPTPVEGMGGEGIWGPIPTFMQRYGLEDAWLSPFQRWQAGYANPLHDVFQLQQLMGLAGGQPEAVWEDYLQPFQGGTAPAYGQAGGVLGGLAAMTPEARAQAGIGWGGQEPLGNLASLLQLALRPHLGLHGAGFFTPGRLGTMRARMHAGQAGGAAPGSFLDYLRQKFNLQRFGF